MISRWLHFSRLIKNVKNDKSEYRHSSKNKDADSVTANPIYDTADTNDYQGYMHLKKCE